MEMFVMLPLLFMVQKVDFTQARNVLMVQCAFTVVQTSILVACAYIYQQINKANNTRVIEVPVQAMGEAARTERQTVKDYDLAQVYQPT